MIITLVSRSFGLATIVLLGLTGTSKAGYLATDLGAGNTYDTTSGYNLTGPTSGNFGLNLAVEFRISGSSPMAFGSAQLALAFRGGNNALTVKLMSDRGGVPGTTLESIFLTNIPAGPSLVTANSTTDTLLNSGTNYWLAAVVSGDTTMTWMQNNQGSVGHLAYQIDFGSGPTPWGTIPGSPDLAYSVSAVNPASALSSVPGPSSALLLGTGLVGLIGVAKRRRSIAQDV